MEIVVLSYISTMLSNSHLYMLFAVLVVDLFTGHVKAFKTGEWNSTVGINGLLRNFCVLLFVLLAFPYLYFINQAGIAMMIVYFFISHYALSVIENLAELGVPMPDFLVNKLKRVREVSGKGEGK